MTLQKLNHLPLSQLKDALGQCCGSSAWIEKMCGLFPVSGQQQLLEQATATWFQCTEQDWLEAFSHHPKIGDVKALEKKYAATAAWAAGEQAAVRQTSHDLLEALAKGNKAYEEKFGFIFIVCATGKLAEEMLDGLNKRLPNSREDELKIAMQEQDKITLLRLKKLLS